MYACCFCTAHTQGGRIEALLFRTIGRLQTQHSNQLSAIRVQRDQVCTDVIYVKKRQIMLYWVYLKATFHFHCCLY
jgi:hypothetical protein